MSTKVVSRNSIKSVFRCVKQTQLFRSYMDITRETVCYVNLNIRGYIERRAPNFYCFRTNPNKLCECLITLACSAQARRLGLGWASEISARTCTGTGCPDRIIDRSGRSKTLIIHYSGMECHLTLLSCYPPLSPPISSCHLKVSGLENSRKY